MTRHIDTVVGGNAPPRYGLAMRLFARFVRFALIAMLVFGSVAAFAAPMSAVQGAAAVTAISAPERGMNCASCPRQGASETTAHCDVACPLLAALVAADFVSKKPGKPTWAPRPVAVRRGIVPTVDPDPPRFSL